MPRPLHHKHIQTTNSPPNDQLSFNSATLPQIWVAGPSSLHNRHRKYNNREACRSHLDLSWPDGIFALERCPVVAGHYCIGEAHIVHLFHVLGQGIEIQSNVYCGVELQLKSGVKRTGGLDVKPLLEEVLWIEWLALSCCNPSSTCEMLNLSLVIASFWRRSIVAGDRPVS
jgi:hypothetical protein